VNTYAYLVTWYLCVLWLWTNWLFWCAGRRVIKHEITASSVAQRRAGATVFGLLNEMQSASRVWTANHAVRAVTTVALAEAFLQLAHGDDSPQFQALSYSFATVLFFIVLATAAAPGFVTTSFCAGCQHQLGAVAHGGDDDDDDDGDDDDDDDDGDGDDDDDGYCCEEPGMQQPKDTPTALMQRIAATRSGTGMHFAGIPMTVEKAVTMATAIFYLTRYFAKPVPGGAQPQRQPWWNGTAVVCV
jgi:hypothetical protein